MANPIRHARPQGKLQIRDRYGERAEPAKVASESDVNLARQRVAGPSVLVNM
jgi:hypothetical protein